MTEGFFNSRWAPRPAHVLEGASLPAGFRLAGAAGGVKTPGAADLDLGLVVCDAQGNWLH